MVGLEQARQDLKELVNDIDHGRVILTRRGKPVAALVPLGSDDEPLILNHPIPVDYLDLGSIPSALEDRGCYPGVSRRGPHTWRAHVNISGNQWDEGSTALWALREAVKAWEGNGRPMDGLAASVKAVVA